MSEQTNLNVNTQESFWDTDEAFEETNQEQSENQEQEQPNTDQEAKQKPDTENQPERQGQVIKVRYNGKDVDVPMEQAAALIQKGMNYDHVVSQRDQLKNAPGNGFLEKLAKASGKSVEAYIAEVESALDARDAQALEGQGLDAASAAEVVKARKEAQKAKEELETIKAQLSKELGEKTQREALRAFFDKNPDVKPGELPKEVLEAVAGGQDITTVYQSYQNKQLQSQIEQLKSQIEQLTQGKNNTKKTVGSVGQSAPETEKDDIWEAFMKG